MPESKIYKEALEAIRLNQSGKARDLLTRLLRTDKENPDYWLWLSAVVESEREQLFCLKSVLRLDPENQEAQQGLRLLGALPPDEEHVPLPPERRSWDVKLDEARASLTGIQKLWANPVVRLLSFVVSGIVVVSLVLVGIFGSQGSLFGPRLTITPIAWTATPSETPSSTPVERTATATPSAPQPLWTLLDATYTPRPLYINTPHPRSEAFRIGLRAYERGDYEAMLTFLEQAQREEPDAVDVYYYVGEAYRLSGEPGLALQSYNGALALDENFAPAYLGRALGQLLTDPDANVEADLRHAITLAPDFADAHLELAAYLLRRRDPQAALDILDQAAELLDDHPRYYVLRASIFMTQDLAEEALVEAMLAYQMDITYLPIYLILGEAYLENDQPEEALNFIRTYGLYDSEQPAYWTLLGRAYYALGEDYHEALFALDQALTMDAEGAMALHYRGLAALAVGDAKQAVNDLFEARNLAPDDFEIGLHFGLALWANGNPSDAFAQVNGTKDLVNTDRQLAKLYYYRAQIAAELQEPQRADLDFQALLDLPEDVMPAEWRAEAEFYLNPPTATPTASSTPLPSPTLMDSPTPTPDS